MPYCVKCNETFTAFLTKRHLFQSYCKKCLGEFKQCSICLEYSHITKVNYSHWTNLIKNYCSQCEKSLMIVLDRNSVTEIVFHVSELQNFCKAKNIERVI